MSPENQGVPEDDDPFAYLYRGEGADGGAAQETAPLPGVPRTSYQHATQVGRTQYGQPRPQQGPGQAQVPGQPGYQGQSAYEDQPTAQYRAPAQASGGYQSQQPGYQPQPGYQSPEPGYQAPPPGGRAGARSGGRSGGRGVMYGTIAVVAAVAIGIGVAVFSNQGKPVGASAGAGTSAGASTGASSQDSDSASASASASASGALPAPADADKLTLGGGAAVMTNHKGAASADGGFVPLTAQGQSISWTTTLPDDGTYYLWVHYANAGADSAATITINGTAKSSPMNLRNFTKATDWDKAWQSSWTQVTLKSGSNTIVISDNGAGQGNVNIDQVAVTKDQNRPWS